MGRENFTVPDEISAKFSELAKAMGVNKTKLFERLVNDEYERRSELLKVHRQQIELEQRVEALRN